MKATTPQPNLNTPEAEWGKVEHFKKDANYARGDLNEQFNDSEQDDIGAAAEQIAKSHGIYLEYNRAKTGKPKDWSYMVRVSIPGGGGFGAKSWRVFDDVANKYSVSPEGKPSIRLTTRQNIQYHWVKKEHVIPLVQEVAQTGYFTLNGCGDNFRNVMGCPLSKFSKVFDATKWAHTLADYFRLPAEAHIEVFGVDPNYIRTPDEHFEYAPSLLNRKFKVGIGAVHQDEQGNWYNDNCVEMRTNEVGISPIIEGTGDDAKVERVQLYVGGGQGEKNGKPGFAGLGLPFGTFTLDNLLKGMDAIVATHQEWGDRQNRHWARLKYVVQAKGIEWYQKQVRDRGGVFESPMEDHDYGARCLHHGWSTQPSNGKLAFGAYIASGRLMDGMQNGDLKKMCDDVLEKFNGTKLMATPNQDLLFTDIEPAAKEDFAAAVESYGHGKRNGKAYSKLRLRSGACVGLNTCRLAYTESEGFEPELIDQLDEMGYGEMMESIGITGCERQCFRPATKTIGLVGQGPDKYELKLGGSEDGKTQGRVLTDGDHWYLRQVPRDQAADVIAALFDHYKANKQDAESMGLFHRRIGMKAIIEFLKGNEVTAPLMERTWTAPYVPDNQNF